MSEQSITSCVQAVEFISQFLQVLPTDAMLFATENHRYIHEQKRRGAAETNCKEWYHIHANDEAKSIVRLFLHRCARLAFLLSPLKDWKVAYQRALAAVPNTDLRERTVRTPPEGPLGSGGWKAFGDALAEGGSSTPRADDHGTGGLVQAVGTEGATEPGDCLSIVGPGRDQYPYDDPSKWTVPQRVRVAEVARDQCHHKYTAQPMVRCWRYRSSCNKTKASNNPVATSAWLRVPRLMDHFLREGNLQDHFGPPEWEQGVLVYPFNRAGVPSDFHWTETVYHGTWPMSLWVTSCLSLRVKRKRETMYHVYRVKRRGQRRSAYPRPMWL